MRGADVQISLRKDDVVFGVDGYGKEFSTVSRDFLSENCKGGRQGHAFQSCARLQEPRPATALRKLLHKLHPEVN